MEDGTLVIPMTPSTNISGWTIGFTMWKRAQVVSGFVSGLITKSAASGFNNTSGINVTNGPLGIFNVNINRFDVSGGLSPGAYAYFIDRRDSGNASIITQGYRLVY